ncbi:FecR family protein [Zobellia galactanivorans]|uniref:Anti-sigma factor n=1 Tax=Zobellia galactanivorans (strain DSM 12802 / CCUG 47099 / CIP 106680 / NCIMB 13871 / Dsij) TaxID=63186 RepID=G0L5T5_ZOBGA|nr:FecR family protein [Zobellia galactanivorans]CAZ96471.1 Anti-sigma factor [Zobellia galactanivorans]
MNYHKLISKWLKGSISTDERQHLQAWVHKSDANMDLFKKCIREWQHQQSPNFDPQTGFAGFKAKISAKKRKIKRLVSAIPYALALLILIVLGIQITGTQSNKTKPTPSQISTRDTPKEKITLTLADGSTQILSGHGNEILTDAQGNIIADKDTDVLSFNASQDQDQNSNAYNEIYIPHGQTFKLRLSDGTKVWLNAGTKLKFPSNLNSEALTARTVFLDGEAYFDVTKNEKKPFLVVTQNVAVKVLGTQFNLSSYDTDENIATTLIEGKVSMFESDSPDNEIELSPSFQAKYKKTESSFSKVKVDTEQFTAWMHNKLIIDNLKFSEILTKLERLHQVKFLNKAEHLNNEVFKGEFENETIEAVLNTISLSTPFNYTRNQNLITIESKS